MRLDAPSFGKRMLFAGAVVAAAFLAGCGPHGSQSGLMPAHGESGHVRRPRTGQYQPPPPPPHDVYVSACSTFSSPAVPKAAGSAPGAILWTLTLTSADSYPVVPSTWGVHYDPGTTQYPTASNLTGTVPCDAPATTYEALGSWSGYDSSGVSHAADATVLIHVSLAVPGPTPTPDPACLAYDETATCGGASPSPSACPSTPPAAIAVRAASPLRDGRRRPLASGGGCSGAPSPQPSAVPTASPTPVPIFHPPTPTPSPTAKPTPPAPAVPKDLYTASLLSHPKLSFTDSAGAAFGTLTWHVAGDVKAFDKLAFASATTTAPNANDLAFGVPPSVKPKDYVLRVSVTSSRYGTTSGETTVTMRVVPPATYESAINAGGVFEEDDAGNVVVSDGSQYATDDDGKQPDFGITVQVPVGSQSSGPRRPRQFSGPFDPLNPPQAVASDLAGFSHKNKFGCWSYLIDDNEAHDRTDPVSPGTLQVYAYCANFWAAPGIQLTQYGINLNTGEVKTQIPAALLPCSHTVGSYGDFRVCSTRVYPIKPVWGHAERVEIRYTLHYDFLALMAFAEEKAGHYVVNDIGAFYPKIAISPDWAVPEVYAAGAGYVPFPPGAFKYCPRNAGAPCLNDHNRDLLRTYMRDAGVPKPPSGFQAHHIKEVMWCGSNDLSNGVFLPAQDTDPSEYDPKDHGKFTSWWKRRNFTPDQPLPLCS